MSFGKKFTAIALSFLMNLVFWLPIDYKFDTVPEKGAEDLRIVSYNVRCANDLYGSVSVRSRFFISLINAYEPDSFGVQEATTKWMKILGKKLGEKYDYVGEMRDETDGTEASAVFYLKDKFNLLDSGTIWLSDTPEEKYTKFEESACVRIASWATLENKESKEVYTHINTHLDHVGETARVMQIEVLKEKITELEKDGNPVVCTGDFNVFEGSAEYEKMTELLSDSKHLAKEGDEGLTYHNYGRVTEGDKPIDFVFVPENAEVSRYRIMDETVKGMFISDHHGVSVDLTF